MTSLHLPLHTETHGLEPGPGIPTFVLVHGYGASSFSWRTWLDTLARRGHVVLVDLKGFGAAPKPDDGAYGPADQAEILYRMILQLDLRRITLVGHSLGGGIALLASLRLLDTAPNRLQRLVIVAGAAYAQRMPPFVWFANHRRVGMALLKLLGSRLVVRQVLRAIVFDPSRITPSQVEGYAQPLGHEGTRRALVDTALQIVPPDLDALVTRYRDIRVPALILWGRHDPVIPLAVGRRLAEELPDARLAVLEACGHLPAEECPEESIEVLVEYLDRTDGDAAPEAGGSEARG